MTFRYVRKFHYSKLYILTTQESVRYIHRSCARRAQLSGKYKMFFYFIRNAVSYKAKKPARLSRQFYVKIIY